MVLATERVIHHNTEPAQPPYDAPCSRPAHATVAGASTSSSAAATGSVVDAATMGGAVPHPVVGWEREEEEKETVTLLRRAVERKDRAVVDGIVRVRVVDGIGWMVYVVRA